LLQTGLADCRNRNRDGRANQKKKTGLKKIWESPPTKLGVDTDE